MGRTMIEPREPLVYPVGEPVQSTGVVSTMIERLRALSVHDLELAKLLDEIEPYLASVPAPLPRPVPGTQFDLF